MMAINKVVYGDQTLIDISDATLSAADLLEGLVAYNRAGERIIGSLVQMIIDNAMSDSSTNPVQNNIIKAYVDSVKNDLGDLSTLTTTEQSSLVEAVNELKFNIDGLGEPFRVKQWANSFNVEIPCCTEDLNNTSIPKMVFSIDEVEGAEYQVVGMIAYEVFDAASGGNRLNVWPVCQFTGNGQKELSVRWMCGGTTRKTARRINAWVLLKHR